MLGWTRLQDATTPRLAPRSREAASRALLITGFVRPFTDRAAREMLSETGAHMILSPLMMLTIEGQQTTTALVVLNACNAT